MTWRKSTHSAADGCCVWVEIRPDGVLVKGDTGPVLRFTHAEWAAFLAGARDGQFDLEADHA